MFNPMQHDQTRIAADHLSSFGRHGDNTLVHMGTPEVNALKGIGALTHNPHTGLPEAFKLADYLPIILGIAGGMMGLPTWALAAGQGALTTARTGDIGKGLTTGLLAGGLGSLTSGLTSAAPGAGNAAASAAGSGATDAATNAASGASGDLSSVAPGVSPAVQAAASGTPAAAVDPSAYSTTLPSGAVSGPPAPGMMDSIQSRLGNAGTNFSNNISNFDPSSFYNSNKGALLATGVGGLGYASQLQQDALKQQSDALNASNAAANSQNQRLFQQYLAKSKQMNPGYNAIDPYTAATGGLTGDSGMYHMALGGLSGDNGRWELEEKQGIEGLLQGEGDGMTDSLPATIEGHTPARLSESEFVLPADIVSHLGNGSSSAGAKVLYTMMDKIRTARHGHPNQGKEIEPDKFLPKP
jgi:hypothetical protein